jgi:hypothetical protein
MSLLLLRLALESLWLNAVTGHKAGDATARIQETRAYVLHAHDGLMCGAACKDTWFFMLPAGRCIEGPSWMVTWAGMASVAAAAVLVNSFKQLGTRKKQVQHLLLNTWKASVGVEA